MCATLCNRGSPLRVDGEAGPGLGGALSRLLGAGQEINCEEEIGNIEREATLLHSTAHCIKLNQGQKHYFHVRDGLILWFQIGDAAPFLRRVFFFILLEMPPGGRSAEVSSSV